MRKRVLPMLFLMCCISLAHEQFTLVGPASFDVRSSGLALNAFQKDARLAGALSIRACESIDNSMVVVFSNQIPAQTLEEWFGNEGICKSLRELLRRGGVLYMDMESIAPQNGALTKTEAFFKSLEIALPNSTMTIAGAPVQVMANPLCNAAFLRTPCDLKQEGMTAAGHFNTDGLHGMETLFATSEGVPVMIAKWNVLGKGTVIFSCTSSPLASKVSPFINNLVDFAYGKREKILERHEMDERINLLLEKRKSAGRNLPYIVWSDNPFNKKFLTSLPDSIDDVSKIEVAVAQNEKESLALLITNLKSESMTFRIEPQFFLKNGADYRELLTIKEVVPRLNKLDQMQLDGICALNQGGSITIPAHETRMMWIDVKTMLPAGCYDLPIDLIPTSSRDAIHKLTVKVEVLDYVFPAMLHPQVYGFGPYVMTYVKGKEKPYFDLFMEYHINNLQSLGNGVAVKAVSFDKDSGKVVISDTPSDYDQGEKMFMDMGARWFYSYGTYAPFKSLMARHGVKGGIANPEFRALFEKYLTNWARHLKSQGIPFDRFYVGIQDECPLNGMDEYEQAGLFMKKCVPDFRIFGTMATWMNTKGLEKFKPFMDLWIPWETRLTEHEGAKAELTFYQNTGKPFMPYLCAIELPQLNMQGYFRFRGIKSFLLGTD